MKNSVVIVGAKRTPIGRMLGMLSSFTAPELGAIAHRAAIAQAGIDTADISEVISGCVLSAGIGQAPARQAAILAGIPQSAGATTINKMCGSGMKALMFAHDLLKAQSATVIVAGGMESMSNAPYLLAKARNGYRLGHDQFIDHMFMDGLEDAYDKGTLMGCFAQRSAEHYKLSRQQQDAYAQQSMERALHALKCNAFDQEIAPVVYSDLEIVVDEIPNVKKIAKIPQLKPAFSADGTVTAANSSAIADGASSLVVMTETEAIKQSCTPLARIVAHATHAHAPEWFTTAPSFAIRKVLAKANWSIGDVDLYEINEAFAVVALLAIKELKLPENKVNIHGGSCALGHPIGASGARIITTLIYALQKNAKKRGIASVCIGGGEACAIAIELL